MKIAIDRRDLVAALEFVSAVSPSRPLQPVLAGVLLTAADGVVTLSAYDYEAAAETTAVADVRLPGVVLVHSATFSKIAAKLPNAPVLLEASERELSIQCGSLRAALPLMPVGEFPEPLFECDPLLSMSGIVFEDVVSRVAVCAAKAAPERPAITGVHLIVSEEGATLTATDRYRIAMMMVECEATRTVALTVPASVMREAAKSFVSSEVVTLGLTESGSVVIEGERGSLLTQTIAGEFPPVMRMFPDRPRSTAVIDRDAMAAATSRAALALMPEGALRYVFTPGECTLTGVGDASRVEDGFPVDFDGSEDLHVSLIPQRVIDGINACRTETVRAWFTHDSASAKPGPVMFTADDGYRYLVVANQK